MAMIPPARHAWSTPHADDLNVAEGWVDDYDGLTFTVIGALARAGFTTDKLYRAVVSPEGNASYVARMVGIIEVEGLYYVVGDPTTRRTTRSARRARALSSCCLRCPRARGGARRAQRSAPGPLTLGRGWRRLGPLSIWDWRAGRSRAPS